MEIKKPTVILIAGCFDPIGLGHLDHIKKASQLGTSLVIVTHTDATVVQKKGYCFSPLEVRMTLLQGLLSLYNMKGAVVTAFEDSIQGNHYRNGIGETLRMLKPAIFAKGGDRTPDNMPPGEIAACQKYGIEIRYGVGDLLSSSQEMVNKVFEQWLKKK